MFYQKWQILLTEELPVTLSYTPYPQCLPPADVTSDGNKGGGALSPIWVGANR